jgi:hypothetical protein
MFSIEYTTRSGRTYECQLDDYGETLDLVTCYNEDGYYPVHATEFEGPARPGRPRRIR